MTGTMRIIGYRASGAPIHHIAGGADDAPEQAAPPPGPAVPEPPAWQPPSREEWEAAQTAQQRLTQLMSEQSPEPADDSEDDEEEPTTSSQSTRDRSKPPTWEDFERLEARQRKAAREAQQLRAERRRQQEAWATEDARRKEEDDRKAAVLAAAEKARADAEAMYRPATIKAAAVPALVAAKAREDRIEMIMGLIDHGALSVEDGEVKGLDEQIAAAKERVPEWFQQPEPERRPVPRVATGDRQPVTDKPARSADILARQILGGAA